MGRYNQFEIRQTKQPWKIHPIWRGIGCLMMIIIPILAYAGAVMLVEQNAQYRWVPMPRELVRTIALPLVGPVPHLYANLVTAVILALFLFGLVTLLYSLLYAMIGPPRYGPLDAPPEPRRPRRRL